MIDVCNEHEKLWKWVSEKNTKKLNNKQLLPWIHTHSKLLSSLKSFKLLISIFPSVKDFQNAFIFSF